MAQFFSPKSNKKKSLAAAIEVSIDSLDHQGQAVAQHQGKIVFVDGLLPQERAKVRIEKDKGRYAKGKLIKRLSANSARVAPACPHFDSCGGCQLQYASSEGQQQFKQQTLTKLVQHHLSVAEITLAPTIKADPWRYRRRARLGAQVHQGQLCLGFRQEQSNNLVSIDSCAVLAKPLDNLIAPLAKAIGPTPLAKQLGHIDLLLADEGAVAVLRVMRAPKPKELERLTAVAVEHQCMVLLHDGDQLTTLDGEAPQLLHYQTGPELPSVAFMPGDFFQVNDSVNQQMIAQAIDWLQPKVDEVGLDLFCGGGNFSFPLASLSLQVTGVEGIESMALRARQQAKALGVGNVNFFSTDLNGEIPTADWASQPVDWVLLDPARAGAAGTLQWMTALAPKRILYVSCSPLTLAQDAKVLQAQGYSLSKLGLIDMFPHTGHLESMALFVANVKK
ncbi:23S rRNA (uracil(1939)-C(5))-methyltransferase RlmD [Ferrimonas lipolytica]|uniref:23S rRNA (uracil(1939)-C(5))-methyltransferase RlmD n=1 Tax=Ferrimonas lipolytica TaxID=2724191 RepID=A0A6H1UBH0_9GAMM|nr:23S rRNA (uracil(1939)-C(5))-methyltransferase RlmD [Ferrimonas lipolytica]QIZ75556.1 23S rRNA (uracil(1939)-C(5))-methyltransferase RlmD [Ferrimonas lipolytica]